MRSCLFIPINNNKPIPPPNGPPTPFLLDINYPIVYHLSPSAVYWTLPLSDGRSLKNNLLQLNAFGGRSAVNYSPLQRHSRMADFKCAIIWSRDCSFYCLIRKLLSRRIGDWGCRVQRLWGDHQTRRDGNQEEARLHSFHFLFKTGAYRNLNHMQSPLLISIMGALMRVWYSRQRALGVATPTTQHSHIDILPVFSGCLECLHLNFRKTTPGAKEAASCWHRP